MYLIIHFPFCDTVYSLKVLYINKNNFTLNSKLLFIMLP